MAAAGRLGCWSPPGSDTSTQLEPLLDAIRVPRPGSGRPRKRPTHLIADRGYSFSTCRRLLRQRRIAHTIPERSDQQAARARRGARGGRPPRVDAVRYQQRNVVEIVCTQVTKPRLGAAWCGRDHVADLHVAVGDHDPVDQQLDQLAALLEAGLAKADPKL